MNATTKALAVLALLVSTAARGANDLPALWAFAEANADRFASELRIPARTFTLRVAPDLPDFNLKYMPKSGYLVVESQRILTEVLTERCKVLGTYVGRTAAGASRQVTRRDCTDLRIQDIGSGFELGDQLCPSWLNPSDDWPGGPGAQDCSVKSRMVVAKVTPDEYREIKRSGLIYEVALAAGTGVDAEVVTLTRLRTTPKVSWPYEDERKHYTVNGRIESVRVLRSDGKTVLATYARPGE